MGSLRPPRDPSIPMGIPQDPFPITRFQIPPMSPGGSETPNVPPLPPPWQPLVPNVPPLSPWSPPRWLWVPIAPPLSPWSPPSGPGSPMSPWSPPQRVWAPMSPGPLPGGYGTPACPHPIGAGHGGQEGATTAGDNVPHLFGLGADAGGDVDLVALGDTRGHVRQSHPEPPGDAARATHGA